MKKIILNNKGQLVAKDKAYFGGKYGFLERLSMDGIGSPRVIYKSGIPYFDEIAFIENELSFVNFELLKDGFLIRLNRNQQLRYIGFQLHEILRIELEGEKKEKNPLAIRTLDNTSLIFEVPIQNFYKLQSFFQKKIFQGKVEIS